MKDFLSIAWTAITSRLGSVATLIPTLASALRVAVASNDVTKAGALCEEWKIRRAELLEVIEAADQLVDHVRASLIPDADGQVRIDALEGAKALQLVQTVVDEAEDLVTGHDEDDPTPAVPS